MATTSTLVAASVTVRSTTSISGTHPKTSTGPFVLPAFRRSVGEVAPDKIASKVSYPERAITLVERDVLRALSIAVSQIDVILSPAPWQLKGASGLLFWLGVGVARLPRDLDVEVAIDQDELEVKLQDAIRMASTAIRYLTVERVPFTPGGKRPVVYRLVYEALESGTPIHRALCEVIAVNTLRDTVLAGVPWANAPSPTVAVARIERLMSEKLRRYAVRRHGGRINTRWVDLADMLLSAHHYKGRFELGLLRRVLTEELAEFDRPWIVELPAAPREWLDFWDAARLESGHDLGSLDNAEAALKTFWMPVLDKAATEDRVWDPHAWQWR